MPGQDPQGQSSQGEVRGDPLFPHTPSSEGRSRAWFSLSSPIGLRLAVLTALGGEGPRRQLRATSCHWPTSGHRDSEVGCRPRRHPGLWLSARGKSRPGLQPTGGVLGGSHHPFHTSLLASVSCPTQTPPAIALGTWARNDVSPKNSLCLSRDLPLLQKR